MTSFLTCLAWSECQDALKTTDQAKAPVPMVCAMSIVSQILCSLCVTPQVEGSPVDVRFSLPVNGPKDP